MKVRFSRLAVLKLEKLSDYLIEEWSEQSNLKFLKRLNARIESTQSNPKMHPESTLEPGLRKCVVTKQTTLLYEIHSDSIFILNVIDNRQEPESIKIEIEKHFGYDQF